MSVARRLRRQKPRAERLLDPFADRRESSQRNGIDARLEGSLARHDQPRVNQRKAAEPKVVIRVQSLEFKLKLQAAAGGERVIRPAKVSVAPNS